MRRGDDANTPGWRDPDPDVEFEISNLDAPADAAPQRVRAGQWGDMPGGPAREAGDTAPPDNGPGAPFTRRMTPLRRALVVASALAVVALALVLVGGRSPGTASVWQALFAAPAPTTTLPPDGATVFVVYGVPWGVLTIDGRRVNLSPIEVSGNYDLIVVARGAHRVVYTAAPFPTLLCRLSVPASTQDTCPLTNVNYAQRGEFDASARALDLQARPDRLPPDQFQALVRAVQAALVFPSGQLAPGDHYARQDGTVVAAASPLQMALLTTLNPSSGATFNGQRCDALCTCGLYCLSSTDSWSLLANVYAAWQLTDGAGNVVQTAPISAVPPGISSPPQLLQLWNVWVRWDRAWSATLADTQRTSSNICVPGIGQLQSLRGQSALAVSTSALAGGSVSDGCLLSVQRLDSAPTGPGTPVAASSHGSVLYRCGALVAADDGAHHLLPQLPLPSAHERAIIAALASGQPAASAAGVGAGPVGMRSSLGSAV